MKLTPTQQRLVNAAQRRRAREYEREYAAWRVQNGLAPAANPFADEDNCQPVPRLGIALLMLVAVIICGVTGAAAWEIVRMIGGAL